MGTLCYAAIVVARVRMRGHKTELEDKKRATKGPRPRTGFRGGARDCGQCSFLKIDHPNSTVTVGGI